MSELIAWGVTSFVTGAAILLIVTGLLVPASRATMRAWARRQVQTPATELPERYRVADDLNRSLLDVVQAAERDAEPQPEVVPEIEDQTYGLCGRCAWIRQSGIWLRDIPCSRHARRAAWFIPDPEHELRPFPARMHVRHRESIPRGYLSIAALTAAFDTRIREES